MIKIEGGIGEAQDTAHDLAKQHGVAFIAQTKDGKWEVGTGPRPLIEDGYLRIQKVIYGPQRPDEDGYDLEVYAGYFCERIGRLSQAEITRALSRYDGKRLSMTQRALVNTLLLHHV